MVELHRALELALREGRSRPARRSHTSGRVPAVPAAGAEAASAAALAVPVLVAQVLNGAEAVQSVLGAGALLHCKQGPG